MNRFYFVDKGVTRKRGCPNIWPVPDREFRLTPSSIFDEPGFVVRIEPKQASGAFIAKIIIFDAEAMSYRPHFYQDGQMMLMGDSILSASYRYHQVYIETSLYKDVEDDRAWLKRQMCIPVLREAVKLFLEYFPEAT
jgi:hypothetical protein